MEAARGEAVAAQLAARCRTVEFKMAHRATGPFISLRTLETAPPPEWDATEWQCWERAPRPVGHLHLGRPAARVDSPQAAHCTS
ncbi:hypothetical protein AAFF_G00258230 [Aldrovandia affinis]|uniref:Uncharacterized protein n=1 Tax=Aldrovandia affinis TaxID=143900 RepID=A0AAD7STB6_9TELE|nr:hypothetical protein AAFF_G00258230 [Aldrovandia affinis]